ncbi:MAG: type II toxin-antitoxin system RelE/ParE family toxin [Mesorhizobium sp.]|nr:type II toxin-antitoxin system RelE/ParE family toxin [Mesorhizobium sp.]
MIRSFRSKQLRNLFEDDDRRKLPVGDVEKIRRILALLDAVTQVEDLDRPGFALHRLKGDLKGYWAVTVRANWRIVFRFQGGDFFDVDYLDYH